jgi:hypothetical protein
VQYIHQSVKDYVAAKKRGDRQTTDRILAEVKARYNTRTTDGSEAAELFDATLTVRFGENL